MNWHTVWSWLVKALTGAAKDQATKVVQGKFTKGA